MNHYYMRITRLPILIKEILRYTELTVEKQRLEKVLETMNESLRSIDDSVQWSAIVPNF